MGSIYIYIYIQIQAHAVDSNQLEHGPGTIYDGCPSLPGFGVGGQPYSNFLGSTVSLRLKMAQKLT